MGGGQKIRKFCWHLQWMPPWGILARGLESVSRILKVGPCRMRDAAVIVTFILLETKSLRNEYIRREWKTTCWDEARFSPGRIFLICNTCVKRCRSKKRFYCRRSRLRLICVARNQQHSRLHAPQLTHEGRNDAWAQFNSIFLHPKVHRKVHPKVHPKF